ncbi:hypothetical protein O181_031699, partial [Austropuccinia psidii MF-1]|nr:hypothetical protein [Austropuccinia psidii MF-1]
MRLRNCPPISVLTTPYTFTPPPLPSLCSRGALPTCSRHHLSLRSLKCPPDMLPTLLTILTLVECTPDMLPTPIILTLV